VTDDQRGAPDGGLTADEDRQHTEGFARIGEALAAGKTFEEACATLEVPDGALRRMIVDDYLKVAVAQRHFQGGESTEAVAAALRVPVERVERARGEMIAEVAARSVEVFRQQAGIGDKPPDGDEPPSGLN